MSDYIKREDLMERVGRWQLNTREAIAKMIMSAPTADVREIKRGRWSFDTIIFTDADGVSRSGMRGYKCSECDGFCIGESNFCPNCGAQMERR